MSSRSDSPTPSEEKDKFVAITLDHNRDYEYSRQRHLKMVRGGGGGRMLCSPYFVVSALVMLSIVCMKYWSLSGQNAELMTRMEHLQLQMKTDAMNLKNLHSKLTEHETSVETCEKAKSSLQAGVEEKVAQLLERDQQIGGIKRELATAEADLGDSRNQLEDCLAAKNAITDQIESQKKTGELLKGEVTQRSGELERVKAESADKAREIATLRSQLERLSGEVATYKAREDSQRVRIEELEDEVSEALMGVATSKIAPRAEESKGGDLEDKDGLKKVLDVDKTGEDVKELLESEQQKEKLPEEDKEILEAFEEHKDEAPLEGDQVVPVPPAEVASTGATEASTASTTAIPNDDDDAIPANRIAVDLLEKDEAFGNDALNEKEEENEEKVDDADLGVEDDLDEEQEQQDDAAVQAAADDNNEEEDPLDDEQDEEEDDLEDDEDFNEDGMRPVVAPPPPAEAP